MSRNLNRPKLSKRNLLFSLCFAVSVGFVSFGAIAIGAQYPVVTIATAAFGAFLLAVTIFARLSRAHGEAAEFVGALHDIGKGKLEPRLSRPEILPGGLAIEAAISSMALQIREKVESLHDTAQRDLLTGLGNRSSFESAVAKSLRSASADSPHCLLFIDLDGFKQVNDTLGHNFGDSLLQIAADRLRLATNLDDAPQGEPAGDATAPEVRIARFGGDEFVVFLGNAGSGTVARRIAARIQRVLSEPFELGSHTATISASIGAAFSPENGQSYSELLRAADTAMYHAKRSGRNRCEFYSPVLDADSLRAAEQEQELREAISRDQLELYFQPLFDVRTMRIASVEALVRWNHPRRGLLLPGEFLPLIERCNLTVQLGEWVLNEAARRIAELDKAGMPLLMAVNISPLHVANVEFATLVRTSLRRWRAPPELLQIEVTEDAAMSNAELAAERLCQLHDMGVSIAIDDFGTGYSNLASLILLPLSRLKIDQSLLRNLSLSAESRVLVQTIISMSNSLGFHSVAEGVETQDQFDLLSAMGCDVVQGYLLSRPIPLNELRDLMSQETAQDVVTHKLTMAC